MHDYSVHHRQARGMGGRKDADTKANLVTLCGSGTTGCHGHVESYRTEALEMGWLVLRNSRDLPEEVPMIDIYGRKFFLTDDGGVLYITKEAS